MAAALETQAQWLVDNTANLLWGREAVEAVEAVEADPSADPPVEAVEAVEAVDAIVGIEQKVRQSEKKLNEAYLALEQARKMLNKNDDPQATADLVQAVRDANAEIISTEKVLEQRWEF